MNKHLKTLVLASHNQGKLKEFQQLLGHSIEIRLISEFSTIEPEETGLSFIENALIKARHAATVSGLPALADDSGLCVDYLQGAPGIYSARYSGKKSDTSNNSKLLTALKNVTNPIERKAQFVCALALVTHEKDPLPIICEGIWQGTILTEPRGSNGFGYDPLFWIESLQCSSAELTPTQKNQYSHRAKALALLKQRLAIL